MAHQCDSIIKKFLNHAYDSIVYELKHDEDRRYVLFRPLEPHAKFLRKVYVMVSHANTENVSRFNVSLLHNAVCHGVLCISVLGSSTQTINAWLFTKSQIDDKRWLRLTPGSRKYLVNQVHDVNTHLARFYNDTVLLRQHILPREEIRPVAGAPDLYAFTCCNRVYVLQRLER